MRGSFGALPSREAGSEAARRVATLEPSLPGRRGLKPWDTWLRVDVGLAPCLDLKLVRGGT
jgi:hypothetical protein